MSRASTYTLLSLDRYAKIMGINPMHFSGGATPSLNPIVMPDYGCSDVWYQYDWQNLDQVSREQIAMLIAEAEGEIANIIGYYPAPVWFEEEDHDYPRPYVREAWGYGDDVRGQFKTITADFGKFLESGERATTLIGTATTAGGTLVYSDDDSDGFYETATITLPTSLTKACEIKAYFTGMSAAQEWEIRPARSVTISGGNVVLVFDSWLLIDPELWEAYPTSDGVSAINISTTINFVTSVEVYREYTDGTATSAQFFWELGAPSAQGFVCPSCGGTGCYVCGYSTQNGCLGARDPNRGILVPSPGTYDSDNAVWDRAIWSEGREPDLVKIWYRAGDLDQRYVKGLSCDPLSHFWAQTIAWLATARIERQLCSCGNAAALAEDLRVDLTKSTPNSRYFVTADIMECPFGVRKGEVMAWRRIKRILKDRRFAVAVV
jgi:hypothetical protein